MATLLRPDPTLYPSPALAREAPPETLAYAVVLNTDGTRPDAVVVLDTDPTSERYAQIVGRLDLPHVGDEVHHFGWNTCSSALCPYAPHPHVERRYFVIPCLGSSRIYIVDTKPDPLRPTIARTIEAEELAHKTGYALPHTVHCGPDGIYVSALGAPDGGGPGGVFTMDHETFDIRGRWELDRGPQFLAYDFWWHLGYDTMLTSEWGTPSMVREGVVPELLLGGKYGHKMHVFDLRRRRHVQELDLGAEQQMVLELRPAHDPRQAYGFVGVVVSTADLSASVWRWQREDDGRFSIEKVIEIPAEPHNPNDLPPLLQGFGAVPPLVTDINLTVDDRFLYVSCWGTGDLIQYDVSDSRNPRETGRVRLGGIASRRPHPNGTPMGGGPQMVEVSRDGRRIYLTNSLYASWDRQFYPQGFDGWAVKLDAGEEGGLELDPRFLVEFPTGERPHQVRLGGGDASSDSYCYP